MGQELNQELFVYQVTSRVARVTSHFRAIFKCDYPSSCLIHETGMATLAQYFIFFFKQKTAYEIASCLVGSEMCIRDSLASIPYTIVSVCYVYPYV